MDVAIRNLRKIALIIFFIAVSSGLIRFAQGKYDSAIHDLSLPKLSEPRIEKQVSVESLPAANNFLAMTKSDSVSKEFVIAPTPKTIRAKNTIFDMTLPLDWTAMDPIPASDATYRDKNGGGASYCIVRSIPYSRALMARHFAPKLKVMTALAESFLDIKKREVNTAGRPIFDISLDALMLSGDPAFTVSYLQQLPAHDGSVNAVVREWHLFNKTRELVVVLMGEYKTQADVNDLRSQFEQIISTIHLQ